MGAGPSDAPAIEAKKQANESLKVLVGLIRK
jgi:hypothetical protein